ncbi:MAG: site-specific DNA-methyltransferase [Verrucomicrobiales bacterium]|nr:site-specific DNA-methyltransferase [Verrucomicrobiales bacterium]
MFESISIATEFRSTEKAVIFSGDCRRMLPDIPDETFQLVVTSPPYNLGKEYEEKIDLDDYIEQQRNVIQGCVRALKPTGSICWQVGNYVHDGSIIPLDVVLYRVFADLGLKLRNRIIWHFEHGLHCSKRFSGRYETVLWFTKSDDYRFDLDAVRVPQKYPGKKHFKGPKAGQYSCNPLGKNPGDVWIIPNVKSNHVEKTAHPCQFPVELIERLVLALTKKDDWVFDPFLGTGTSIIAAIRHGRRGAGAETHDPYVRLASERIAQAVAGTLPVRPMARPVFDPKDAGRSLTTAPWQNGGPCENLLFYEEE